jgi:hypothetical protein
MNFEIKDRERLTEPWHYRASGLDDVYLLNGVIVRDDDYGDMVEIEDIYGLHHAITRYLLVERGAPLTDQERRWIVKTEKFLRRGVKTRPRSNWVSADETVC